MEYMFDEIGPFIPLLIFLSRVVDVSIGTVRMITVVKGYKILATCLGFVEVLIWLIAIGQVMKNLTSWYHYVAYAGGFAAGTFVGMVIERKISLGTSMFRIVTRTEADGLVHRLNEGGFSVTYVDAVSTTGPVKVMYLIVKRRQVNEVIGYIRRYNPQAFYSIEDVLYVSDPLPGAIAPALRRELALPFRWFRKGK